MILRTTRTRPGARAATPGRRGLTLLEVVMTLSILVAALLGLAQALLDSMTTNALNRQVALATDGARRVVSDLQGADFGQLFGLYNSGQQGSPLGGRPVQGGGFEIEGLTPLAGDADGLVGRILFPEVVDAAGLVQLREDLDDDRFGTPRDLNGDGVVGDALDHSGDYRVLPVVIEVDWRGPEGPAHVEFKTVLSRY
jgi:type II secretory pathway pseudopilin PulG